jgi:hypothetical protein
MTIAACYVSPEGVVLGADSASTYNFPTGAHHYNYGQKLFEIGSDGTLGLVTWGMGGLELGSYRTLVATIADALLSNPVTSVAEVAEKWAGQIWPIYNSLSEIQRCRTLNQKLAFDQTNPTDPARHTIFEEMQFLQLTQICSLDFVLAAMFTPIENR